jgi:transposase, IS5 family
LGHIDELLDMFEMGAFPLCFKSQRYMWIVREVYRQQLEMYTNKVNRCDDRIVSLHQPHVRPIVRGKQKAPVEFGSKLSVGLDNGFTRVERLSWDAFNECADLPSQVEAYKSIHVHYPEVVQADKIYFTKENRKFLEERNIRFTGVPLGRPSKEKEKKVIIKRKRKKRKATGEII